MQKKSTFFLLALLAILPGILASQVGIDVLYPNTGATLQSVQNDSFNVTLNISCLSGTCGVVDVFLYKEADNASLVWNKTYDGENNDNDNAYGIAVDAEGYVYITGRSDMATAGYDCQTIKYDPSGNKVWNVSYDAGGTDTGRSITVDDSGYVFVASSSQNYVNGASDTDWVIIKYNSSGQHEWNISYNGPDNNYDYAIDIALDDSGNIYVTGSSEMGGNARDILTRKYNSAGSLLWSMSYDQGEGIDQGYGIALDSSGNVYVAGIVYINSDYAYYIISYNSTGSHRWNSTHPPTPGYDGYAYDIYEKNGFVYVTGRFNNNYTTLKLNSSTGSQLWNVTYDRGSIEEAYGVVADSSDNVYVTGYNGLDFFTIKYDSSGNEIWNHSFDSAGSTDTARDMVMDYNGDLYITGDSYHGGVLGYDYHTIKLIQKETMPTGSGTPFFTNASSNPLQTNSLSPGQSELVIFWVNSSGDIGTTNEMLSVASFNPANQSDPWTIEITGSDAGSGEGKGYVNVSITTTLAIEVIQEDVDFGEGAVDAGYSSATLYTNQDGAATQVNGNWTLPNAKAIEVRNVGNINCSLDISSSKTASSFLGGTNPEYQWKVSDKESGSCSGGLTHSMWYDVNSSARLCQHLSPLNSSDEIFLDIRVVVPYDANPTDSLVHKTDILTLTASAVA
jgi:hypothetical protein